LLDLVNPLHGTRATAEFSRGNTLPLVQRPWAPTAWSLATGQSPWFFQPELPKLRGLRCFPAGLELCPQTGPLVADPVRRASAYRLDRALVSPYRLKTEFLRYRVAVDLAPTETGAVLRTTWGEGGVSRLLIEVAASGFDAATGEVRGQGAGGAPFGIAFDRPVVRWGAEEGLSWVEFDLPRGTVVEARIWTAEPLEPSLTLEQVADEGAAAWRRLLGRFVVEGGTEDQQRTFYSCLYRALCVPRQAPGENYRTLFPLYALAYRDELSLRLSSWLKVAQETGRLPEGPVESVFADAAALGVEFDLEAVLPLLTLGDAFPAGSAVSQTLERAYRDWCVARLSRQSDDRSQRWQSLFDPSMGFFRPQEPDGTWTEGFNPLAWGGSFSQGSAWQGGWTVPHDPEGLIAALGGNEVALARLDTLLALRPLFHLGAYDREIPAMTQMATSDFGQYAHSLSATHGILWHYALAGRPDKTDRLTRRVLAELYGPGVDGLCGDDRDGEQAAWYVWAALGLYPFCPGSGDYVLGSPLFPRVTVTDDAGRRLTIEAPGNGPATPVVRKRTLGNVVLTDARVSRADLFDLERLVCEMQE